MISVDYDQHKGLIRYRREGSFVGAEVRSHHEDIRRVVERCRKDHGRLRMLILCGGSVQSADTVDAAIRERKWAPLNPSDRSAYVGPSALLKMQLERSFTTGMERCFFSRVGTHKQDSLGDRDVIQAAR